MRLRQFIVKRRMSVFRLLAHTHQDNRKSATLIRVGM